MIEVSASVAIDRSAADVFEFLADMSNNTKWQKGMRACTWTSEPPLRVGSTYDQEASFLGKKIVSSFEVVELEPSERIRIRTTRGTMPIDVTRSVEAHGDGSCIVSAVVRGDSSKVFRVAEPLMRTMVERSVRADYRRLKELLET